MPILRTHAADVLRNFHVILNKGGLLRLLFPHSPTKAEMGTDGTNPEVQALPLLAMYFAAIIHDFDHRGVTNAFLIQDGDKLAVSERRGTACRLPACLPVADSS